MIIKKLNNVFHRHSRWLFGAFTIVIIVSFLGFLTPGTFGFGSYGGPESIKMGTAYGESVTYGQLRDISRNVSIFSELFYGAPISRDLPPENLFFYACVLEKAKKLGLTVSDKEVADLISKTPAFNVNGKFDKAAYTKAAGNLRANGITEKDLFDAFRQQILLEKLQRELTSGITVTDNEAEEMYRKLNTRYTVRNILFPAEKSDKIAVTDAELQQFFTENKSNYTIPGSVSALVVEIPYAAFANQAKKAATADAAQKLFDNNPKAFATDKIKDPKFNDVKAVVTKKLIENKTREYAVRAAYDFANSAFEKLAETAPSGKEKAFRDLADKSKLVVIEAGTANFNAQSIGKIRVPELVRQLSNTSAASQVTDPVAGEKAVYIGFAKELKMPRPAELNEVKAKVMADCKQGKSIAGAMKKATEFYGKYNQAKSAEQDKLLAALKGCTFTNFEFTMQTPPQSNMQSAFAVINLKAGAIVSPYMEKNNAVVAQLIKRTPADMSGFAKQKELYSTMVRQYKTQLSQQTLQEDLNANCRFEGLPQGQN